MINHKFPVFKLRGYILIAIAKKLPANDFFDLINNIRIADFSPTDLHGGSAWQYFCTLPASVEQRCYLGLPDG